MKKEGKGMRKRLFEESSGRRIPKPRPVDDDDLEEDVDDDDYEEDDFEERNKKKLYMFFSHPGGMYSHTLYSVKAPLDDVPPHPGPLLPALAAPPPRGGRRRSRRLMLQQHKEEAPAPRQAIEPVLWFHRDAWPNNMSCASFGKQLFFLGGMKCRRYPKKVHVLDLTTTDLLRAFANLPSQILKPAPKLNSGKIHQEVFVAGSKLYVVSGEKFNRISGRGEALHQLEFLDLTSRNPEWKVGAAPPFTDHAIGPYTIIDESVLVIYARERYSAKPGRLYSYHLKEDRWDDFDASSWTNVCRTRGFFFSAGAKCIGDSLFTTFGVDNDTIPVIARYQKKDDSEEERAEEEVDLRESRFDVIKSTIECRMLSCKLVDLGTTSTRMALLQAGNPLADTDNPWEDFNGEETHITLSFFDIVNGRTPTYVTSSHYLTKPGRTFIIAGANLV